MEVVYPRCCGLDVHKKKITACVLVVEPEGSRSKALATFGTMTGNLRQLAEWLHGYGVTQVAMESTGVYWKPIWNILEGQFQLLLVNPRHMKAVPGRKTDIKDCEWIAQLLQHGLLRSSFVPARPMRELRDLTRYRTKLAQLKATLSNRIQKVLEDGNIKLASVASDVLGRSGRAMLEAMQHGQQDPAALAELAQGQLRGKIPQLREALEGELGNHHRFLLGRLLAHLRFVESEIALLDQAVEQRLDPDQQTAVARWDQIKGVDRVLAQTFVAEIGTHMEQFPSADHLASWTRICPGNKESAGKRYSGKTGQGNRWLRRALCEAAWAASHTKGTYLSAQYRRLAAKRGKKRAIVAVAHTILRLLYEIQQRHCDFVDLGSDYFDRRQGERLTHYYVKRLRQLGHDVTLQPLSPDGLDN